MNDAARTSRPAAWTCRSPMRARCIQPLPSPRAKRKRIGDCSMPSPTAATVIRPLSGSIRRMALSLTSRAAPICSAGKRHCAATSCARLAAEACTPRLAVADTVGCAWAVARYRRRHAGAAAAECAQALRAAAGGGAAARPGRRSRRLPKRGSGASAISSTCPAPRSPPALAKFSSPLDQALGRLDEPITPRLPVPSYVAERRFPDPIGLERDVLATIARLAAQARRRHGAARRTARGCCRWRCSAPTTRSTASRSAPPRRLREPSRIARLFADRLAAIGEACDPGFGFDMVRLAALVTEAQRADAGRARICRALASALHGPDDDAELRHLIDRLGARFGPRRVTRLVPQDTHVPEFAVTAVPALCGIWHVRSAPRQRA